MNCFNQQALCEIHKSNVNLKPLNPPLKHIQKTYSNSIFTNLHCFIFIIELNSIIIELNLMYMLQRNNIEPYLIYRKTFPLDAVTLLYFT